MNVDPHAGCLSFPAKLRSFLDPCAQQSILLASPIQLLSPFVTDLSRRLEKKKTLVRFDRVGPPTQFLAHQGQGIKGRIKGTEGKPEAALAVGGSMAGTCAASETRQNRQGFMPEGNRIRKIYPGYRNLHSAVPDADTGRSICHGPHNPFR